jgi:hypothetical protein
MSHNPRNTAVLSAHDSNEVAEVRGTRLFRPAALPLLLVFVVALAAAMIAALQLDALENDHLPALHAAQQLDATSAVTGVALRRADLAGADSLADRFHVVAGSARGKPVTRAQMRSYDASFVDYYVSARRVAQGTSMSEEADLSSAESATLAHGVLKERLDTGMAANAKVVDSTSAAAIKLRIAVCLLFALFAAAGLYLLAPRRRISNAAPADAAVADATVKRDAVSTAQSDNEQSHLQEAVRRMAERRRAVARATAQVAERNRQQVTLLEARQTEPALTVIRGDARVLRTRVNPKFPVGKRALAGV